METWEISKCILIIAIMRPEFNSNALLVLGWEFVVLFLIVM